MSNNTPKLLDVIALTIDLPLATRKILDQLALDRGQLLAAETVQRRHECIVGFAVIMQLNHGVNRLTQVAVRYADHGGIQHQRMTHGQHEKSQQK